MKMKRVFLFTVLCLLIASQGLFAAKNDTITWRFSYSMSADHIWSQTLREWAEIVTKKTNGKMKFELFYNDALGSQKEVLEQMRLGITQGNYCLETLSYWVPEIDIYGVGYLFKDEEHLLKSQEGEVGRILEEKMIAAGFRPIYYHVRAPRNITTNKPINKLSDLKGQKIRVPEAPANVALFQALGAKVTALAFQDVVPGLQAGVIDGQENPLDLIYDTGLYEVQKYIAMTEHQRQVIFVLVSEKAYQALPAEYKAIINEAAKVAQESGYRRFKAQEKELKAQLEAKGMTFTYPDQAEFRAAAANSYKVLNPKIRELIKVVQEID